MACIKIQKISPHCVRWDDGLGLRALVVKYEKCDWYGDELKNRSAFIPLSLLYGDCIANDGAQFELD